MLLPGILTKKIARGRRRWSAGRWRGRGAVEGPTALGPGVLDPPSVVVPPATQLSRHRIGKRLVVRARSCCAACITSICRRAQWP